MRLFFCIGISFWSNGFCFRCAYLLKINATRSCPPELVLCLPELVEGKNKRLILNNIENKLLKIICAVVNSGTAYTENYKTINKN